MFFSQYDLRNSDKFVIIDWRRVDLQVDGHIIRLKELTNDKRSRA